LLSTFSIAAFFARADFFALEDVDLPLAFGLLTLSDAAASALLFFATAKILPELLL
jgi:hypothetical protein